MKDFRQLKVWNRAHQLTPAIYHITRTSPREETSDLLISPSKSGGLKRNEPENGRERAGARAKNHGCSNDNCRYFPPG